MSARRKQRDRRPPSALSDDQFVSSGGSSKRKRGDEDGQPSGNQSKKERAASEPGPEAAVKAHQVAVVEGVKGHASRDGRVLSSIFMKLPSKRQFPEYYTVIEQPIDLATIEQNVLSGQYATLEALVGDMNLMFTNAQKFNEPGSEVFNDARTLRKLTKKLAEEPPSVAVAVAAAAGAGAAVAEAAAGDRDANGGDTPNPKQLQKKMQHVLDKLRAAEDDDDVDDGLAPRLLSEIFEKLPSKKQYPDYYRVITQPMDLRTIQQRVEQKFYHDLATFEADLNLMFNNAQSYNQEGSEVYTDATKLRELMKRELARKKSGKLGRPKGSKNKKTSGAGSDLKIKVKLDDGGKAEEPSGGIKLKLKTPKSSKTPKDKAGEERAPLKLSIRTPDSAAKLAKENKRKGSPGAQGKGTKKSKRSSKGGDGDSNDEGGGDGDDASEMPNSIADSPAPGGSKNETELARSVYLAVRSCRDEEGRELCEIFLELPSAKEYPSYYSIIKNPIDMAMIKERIDKGKYASLKECVADFDLMFDNAQTYNEVGSDVYNDAQRLRAVVHSKATAFGVVVTTATPAVKSGAPKMSAKRKDWKATKSSGKKKQKSGSKTPIVVVERERVPPRVFKLHESDPETWVTDIEFNEFLGLAKGGLFKLYPSLGRRRPTDRERAILQSRGLLPANSLAGQLVTEYDAKEIMAGRDAPYKVRARREVGVQQVSSAVAAAGGDENHELLVAALAGNTLVLGKQQAQPPSVKDKELHGQDLYQHLFDHIKSQTAPGGRRMCDEFMLLPTRREQPDYYEIISYPIDLQTIQHRIKTDAYEDAVTFVHDFVLVFKNAQIFNEEDSQIYDDAAFLFEEFARKAREMLPRQTVAAVTAIRPGRSPLQALMDYLMAALQGCTHFDRRLCEGFNQLPDPRQFPEYYEAIQHPIALCTIRERIETNYYSRLDQFQEEMFTMFRNARYYNELNSDLYNDSVQLQKVFISVLSKLAEERLISSPALDYTLEKLDADLRSEAAETRDKPSNVVEGGEEAEREPCSSLTADNGVTYHVGEYVYIKNTLKEDGDPHIGCIARLWTAGGTSWCRVLYFFRPGETYHVASRAFFKQEVLRSNESMIHALSEIQGKCYVAFIRDYLKTVPEGFEEKDIYVCESRYSTKGKHIQKIKQWQKPEFEFTLVPREEPLHLSDMPKVKSVFSLENEEAAKDEPPQADSRNVVRDDDSDIGSDYGDPDDETQHYALFYLDGVPYRLGDCVYVESKETDEPHIARIDDMWTDAEGQAWFYGCWFVRPSETHHEVTRQFYEKEVLRSSTSEAAHMSSVISHCCVLSLQDFCRVRPLNIHEEDVYVCESRYYEKRRVIAKIRGLGDIKSNSLSRLPAVETQRFAQPIMPEKVASPLLTKMHQEQENRQRQDDALRRFEEQKKLQMEREARHAERAAQKEARKAAKAAAVRRAIESQNGTLPVGTTAASVVPTLASSAQGSTRQVHTGYRVFENEQRAELTSQNLPAHEFQRNLIHKWQALSDPSRRRFEAVASALNDGTEFEVLACGWANCPHDAFTADSLKEHVMREHLRHSQTFACQWHTCAEPPYYQRSDLADHLNAEHLQPGSYRTKTVSAKEFLDRQQATTGADDPAWRQHVDQSEIARVVDAETQKTHVQYSEQFLEHVKTLKVSESADPPRSKRRTGGKRAVHGALSRLATQLQVYEGPQERC